jgi:hypothetical protein
VRKAANATAVKAIWVDIDVGPSEPGKKPKYPDLPTALKAILHFIAVTKLPPPSAIVYSGGGIHIYWISKTSMTPQEWQPYAGGLKNLLLANNILADTGLTTDIARILRVPGTKNFKYNPPADVTIAPMSLIMYDFATALPMLPPLAGPVLNPTASAAAKPSLFAEGVDPKTFGPPHPAFAAFKDNLNEGIGPEEHLLKAEPIFQQCGFYREALLNAGANNDQPQWNLAILGTTFMEMGDDIAHRISSGHGSYSKDDTQTFFDRKMDERLDRGIGYPSCATIAGTGCQACKTCPLLGKVRSPLNIRPVVTARVNLAPEDAPQADPSFVDPSLSSSGPNFL